MDFLFTQEQEQLREVSERFFAARGDSLRLRTLFASKLGFAPEVWREVVDDLGWTGIGVPEEFGGIGLGTVEIAIIQEALGASLYPLPLLATVGMAIPAILAAGSPAQRKGLLPDIASGRIATLACCGEDGLPQRIDALITPEGTGFRLEGAAGFVPFGHAADLLIVAARNPASSDHVSLVALDRNMSGLTVTRPVSMDIARPIARLQFDDVHVSAEAVLGRHRHAARALACARDIAAIALAAEQIGGAARCLEMSVAHAKQRVAFGRPIGGFQAIKHMLAEMTLLVETGRAAVHFAARAADDAAADGNFEALAQAASTAKAYCSEAFFRCAADTIQVHGGMGFTWEHDAHLYFKHARCSATELGDPAWHRERVARSMLGPLGEAA